MSGPWHGEKWVRIMCDFAADAVWNIQGESCDIDDLPISQDLGARLRDWQAFYDQHAPAYDPPDEVWDAERFSQEGLELARAVKTELPGWTVIYFDEHRASQSVFGGPRSAYEFEVV